MRSRYKRPRPNTGRDPCCAQYCRTVEHGRRHVFSRQHILATFGIAVAVVGGQRHRLGGVVAAEEGAGRRVLAFGDIARAGTVVRLGDQNIGDAGETAFVARAAGQEAAEKRAGGEAGRFPGHHPGRGFVHLFPVENERIVAVGVAAGASQLERCLLRNVHVAGAGVGVRCGFLVRGIGGLEAVFIGNQVVHLLNADAVVVVGTGLASTGDVVCLANFVV